MSQSESQRLAEIAKKKREQRNREIADDVKNGNYTPPRVNLQESWYPIRGKIKKDPKAVALLHGVDDEEIT